ncbi:MAG: hypothetical protein K2P94_05735 [Rhodospirillaceae bacterium]|nr:hypothetical protein [Rhodospirillaceae bacterium]
MSDKFWFRRGRAGIGYRPQTWQGWASLAAFLVLLGGSVELVQWWLGDDTRGRTVVFVVAAVEILGFMKFLRGRAEAAPLKK